MKLPVFVYMEWLDAGASAPWQSIESTHNEKLVVCRTGGWLLVYNRERVVISSTLSSEGGALGHLVIPRPWITKMVVLKDLTRLEECGKIIVRGDEGAGDCRKVG